MFGNDYNFDMDPELKKYLESKMTAPEVAPQPLVSEDDLRAKLRNDLLMRAEQLPKARETYQAGLKDAQNPDLLNKYYLPTSTAWARGLGVLGSALLGGAGKDPNIGAVQNIMDRPKRDYLASNIDPDEAYRNQLQEYLKVKALGDDDKKFAQQKELKQMSLDEARARTQADQNFQKDLLKQKTDIELAKPKEGEKVADREFAKDYNEWNTRGKAQLEKNLAKLERTLEVLDTKKNDTFGTSGRFTGRLPDVLRSEESIRLREDVHAAVQGALRATLGAQFTEKEGERIMNASYNEKLSPEENMKKIGDAIQELKTNAQMMEDRSQYFKQNGTLKGWEAGAGKSTFNFPMQVRKDGKVATVKNAQELEEAKSEGWQ